MNLKSIFIFSSLLLVLGITNSNAQQGRPRQSPKQSVSGKIGDANLTINYGSPAVKGRKIWGELVPFDKVWRAGANEATIFETDQELKVEGKKLSAGKYSLYTIPGEKDWQIIFNSQVGQWGIERTGETTRKEENDVLVVKVKPRKSSELQESLVYTLGSNGFILKWEFLEIPVSLK